MDSMDRLTVMMEAAHQVIHEMEPDFDETITVALTERDAIIIGLGLTTIWILYPCLMQDSRELQQRMVELVQAQKPEWGVDGED